MQYTYCPISHKVKVTRLKTLSVIRILQDKNFLQKSCRKCVRETSFRPLFLFQKSFICDKNNWSAAYIHYIFIALNLACKKNKLYKTVRYWSRDMLDFDFLEKSLVRVYPSPFVNDFSRKIFPMLYSINKPNFIVWLPLLLEILGNIYITIICFQGCNAINFVILPYLSNQAVVPVFSRQKSKYLENEKRF